MGFAEFRILLGEESTAAYFCLGLDIVVISLLVLYIWVDTKVRHRSVRPENWKPLTTLSQLAGAILLIFTLAGFLFFVYIVPRIR